MTFPKWSVNGNENLVRLCSNFSGCPEAIDLLTQMMQLEPSKRISVKAALAHPFFKDIKMNEDEEMNEFTDSHIEIARSFIPYNH